MKDKQSSAMDLSKSRSVLWKHKVRKNSDDEKSGKSEKQAPNSDGTSGGVKITKKGSQGNIKTIKSTQNMGLADKEQSKTATQEFYKLSDIDKSPNMIINALDDQGPEVRGKIRDFLGSR